MIAARLIMPLSLFLIGALHAMIFAFFEFPGNFLLGVEEIAFACKIVLYTCAIVTSLSHQWICRLLGLKRALVWGLFFNIFGLLTLWINQEIGTWVPLIFLDMIFFGIALPSVINALITYLILEFPRHIRTGIISLFAAFNGGVMLAPLLIEIFNPSPHREAIYPLLLFLLFLSIWFVAKLFFDPHYPAHLEHLRRGTLIWKELHYRLALFLLAIICYGLAENTFNLWGFAKLQQFFGTSIADETVSLFWLFLIIGQVTLLIPLHFFRESSVFYLLISLLMADLYFLSSQMHLQGFIASLIIGGFGCSVVFPLLLAMVQRELAVIARKSHILPYVETSVSILIAGYLLGIGIIDLQLTRADLSIPISSHPFFWGMTAIGTTGLIALFLNLTTPSHQAI